MADSTACRMQAVDPAGVDRSIFEDLRFRAETTPETIALIAPGGEALTFGEFWRRIHEVAATTATCGLRSNDVIALSLPDETACLVIALGVMLSSTCAPLNPAFRESELASSLNDLRASAVIVQAGSKSAAAEVARNANLTVLEADAAGSLTIRFRAAAGACRRNAGTAAMLLQTSATTGAARLVPLTHLNVLEMTANSRSMLKLTDADRFLNMMPFFHLQGFLSSVAQLMAGGSVVCTGGFQAERFASWIEQFHPTWYTAGPALHAAILPIVRERADLLRRFPLRFARSIGAALPSSLRADLEEALFAPVLEGYGMTETGMVTSNEPPPGLRRPGSAGRSAGLDLAILDESGGFQPACAEGEIAVRGRAVMHAYRNNPEANRCSFRDGWLLTGDLGFLDEDGFLFVTGRRKEMINRGGEKILPADVDQALEAHPAVAEAAAFGIPHSTMGEEVAAAVVLKPGPGVAESDLRAFVAARLAGFKVPRRIFFVDRIPHGATGKSQRLALAEECRSILGASDDVARTQRTPHVPPSNEVEQRLAAIWARVLKADLPGIHHDFFELGGDSFAVTAMIAEVEAGFDVAGGLIDASGFFSNPTIATLARIISSGSTGTGALNQRVSPFVVLQPGGSRIPFFCFPGADENPYYFRHLAAHLGPEQPFYAMRELWPAAERRTATLEEMAARYVESMHTLRNGGPWILGGHCYGGIMAFEVARQLVSRGESVQAVLLFETPAPGYPKVVRNWTRYARAARLALTGRLRIGRQDAVSHLGVVGRLAARKTTSAARRALFRSGLRTPAVPEELYDGNVTRARVYSPGVLSAKVVHFISASEQHSTLILDDPRLGWRDRVRGEFEVRAIHARANSFFVEPAVSQLGREVRSLLLAL